VANANFTIGKTYAGEYFSGVLDNLAIFDDALTAGEIATIASGDFSAFGVGSTATPEPGSLLLTAAAGAILFAAHRKAKSGDRLER
jgi:hypothetical protein